MDQRFVPRSFGTHDGGFHADEVTACSLLLLFDCIDRDKILRTRDFSLLEKCDFVCDVGGVYDPSQRRFDHHQAEYQGPLSSAGMILLYLKEKGFLSQHLYEVFNNSLVRGVDAHDNGVAKPEPGTTSFSQVVSNFLPIDQEAPKEEVEAAFQQALDFVLGHLRRLKDRANYTLECQKIVDQVMREGKEALFFESSIPWIESFFELGGEQHPAQFIIMPSGKHWKLRGIPPSLSERMKVRKPLPESWAGLQEEKLVEVTNIPGAIFCHKGRFISIWETKEAALQALRRILQGEVV